MYLLVTARDNIHYATHRRHNRSTVDQQTQGWLSARHTSTSAGSACSQQGGSGSGLRFAWEFNDPKELKLLLKSEHLDKFEEASEVAMM